MLLKVVLPLLVYSLVLLLPLPPYLGLAIRYHPAIALLVILLTLHPLYRWRGRWATPLHLAIPLLLFGLPLAGLWNSGASEYPVVVGGVLPLTDGQNYYEDAQRLLVGVRFDAVSSGRPLFAAFLGVLLALTQQNLQVALAILVALGAIACYLLVRTVQQTDGVGPSVLVMAILFLFYRRFTGAAWTEHLGLAWGTIALTLFWRSVQGHRPSWRVADCLSGLFFLTLAMNARSGALLVLPLLMVWGSRVFRRPAQVLSWRVMAAGLGAIALGFALNYGLLTTVGRADVGFSNLSYNLYAQVVGSHDWRQVRLDYPDVLHLDQPQVTYRIYELAWIEFLRDPLRLLKSSLEAIATYLSPTAEGLFGFVSTYGITLPSMIIAAAFYVLGLLGVLHCCHHRRDPRYSLLLTYGLGIILSLPLAPPWIDGVPFSMRVYAATLPVIALLPAIGWARLLSSVSTGFPPPPSPPLLRGGRAAYGMGLGLVILAILAPIAIALLQPLPPPPPYTCPAGQASALIYYSPGAALHLVEDNALPHSHLPQVRLSDFRAGVATVVGFLARRQSLTIPEMRALAQVGSDRTILHPLNLQTHYSLWVVAPSRLLPVHASLLALCGMEENQVFYPTVIAAAKMPPGRREIQPQRQSP